MAARKKKAGKAKRKGKCVSTLPAPREAWMLPGKISVKDLGRCNILLVVPHGFPGDDENVEILGYHLAEQLQCYAVINNRKYMKDTNSTRVQGFVADLSIPYYAARAADYITPLVATVESIHQTFEKPPLLLYLGGLDGTPPLNPAPPFCAVQIDGGYGKKYHPKVATASKETIENINSELEKAGFVPWDKASQAQDTMLGYFRDKLSYPVECVRIGVPFAGFRDNVDGLEEGAALLAEAFRNISAYQELAPGQFQSASDRALTTTLASPTLEEPEEPVDQELIEEAVSFINETLNKTMYKGAEEIGAFVLKGFFDNNIDAASSRAPKKPASYRRLCEREDLLLSPKQLSVMVRVAAQESFLSESGVDASGLSYTHKAELVKLPNTDDKLILIREALENGLTTRALEARVREIRQPDPRGNKVGPAEIARYVQNPVKLFEDPDIMAFVGDSKKLRKLPADFRARLHADAFNMIERIAEWKRNYASLVRKLDNIAQKEQKQVEEKDSKELLRRGNS